MTLQNVSKRHMTNYKLSVEQQRRAIKVHQDPTGRLLPTVLEHHMHIRQVSHVPDSSQDLHSNMHSMHSLDSYQDQMERL